MRLALLLAMCAACSSSSSPAGFDASPPAPDSPAEAPDEAQAPEAGTDAPASPDASDGQPDAAMDAWEEPIEDAAAPFDGCAPTPPGDGGTRCALYSQAIDGAIVDEAGNPTGISVSEACAPGHPCVACLGGALFAGVCE